MQIKTLNFNKKTDFRICMSKNEIRFLNCFLCLLSFGKESKKNSFLLFYFSFTRKEK